MARNLEDSTVSVVHKLPKLTSRNALLEASRLAGSHFFEPATMRGFGSKLADDFYPLADSDGLAALFITSERDRFGFAGRRAWDGKRLYTVRLAQLVPDKGAGGLSIDEAGTARDGSDGFGGFGSLATARKHAAKIAEHGTPERHAMATAQAKRHAMNRWALPAYLEADPIAPIADAFNDGMPADETERLTRRAIADGKEA